MLLFEFKVQIAEYLATLGNTSIRTLADLIAFDINHCPEEMEYFGQEVFLAFEATSGDLTDPEYVAARALCLQLSRDEGIDAALQRDNLDAIIAPSYSFASSPAAVAGYPNISIPVGITTNNKPAGIWMYGTFLHEPELIGFAYDLEQELRARTVSAVSRRSRLMPESATHPVRSRHPTWRPSTTWSATWEPESLFRARSFRKVVTQPSSAVVSCRRLACS